jgi:hypothetical protein
MLPASLTTDTEQMPDHDAGDTAARFLVLRLELDRTERPAGVISRMDGSAEQRFGGWIDFMTAIDALKAMAEEQPGSA